MAKKVKPNPTGIWKQVARVQRIALSGGLTGRGGHWLAVGVGAWGLQRLHSMAGKEDEILLREPIGAGETLTITSLTTTHAEAKKAEQQAEAEGKRLEKRAQKAKKRAKKARKGLSRAERRQRHAQKSKGRGRKRRRRSR